MSEATKIVVATLGLAVFLSAILVGNIILM